MQVFEMASHGALRSIFWIALSLNVLCAGFVVYAMRAPVFSVTGNQLVISGSPWGRSVPVDGLRLVEARQLDLSTATDMAPARRLNGIGLPGFRGGWFRLANGEKALVFVGRGNDAVYIPTTLGFALMIAPAEPAALLSALSSAQGEGQTQTTP